jgi:pimeloyl-ACP methyl ester carboxylesterase
MPAAELTVYDNCGHLPFMEYADRFNREVIALISETGGRTDR